MGISGGWLRRRRVLILAVAIVVLAAAGGGIWAGTRSSSAATTTPSSLVTVSAQTLVQSVSTSGTIEPAVQSSLSFSVAGTVTAVHASVGAKVAKGAVLAQLGTTDLQSAVDSAQANLAAADADLASLQSVSTTTSTQLASAQAQVAAATNTVSTARQSLAAATLTSPIAGTVASVGIASGDRISGSSSGSSGVGGSGAGTSTASSGSTEQIVVISTSSWLVDASVGSADLASLKTGLQAVITPTGATANIFGVVSSVGVVASSSSGGSATFPVTIAVTGSPTGLYAGGSASVAITVKQLQNVLTAPTNALHSVNGKTVVYQKKNGQQVSTPVTVGAVFGVTTQITAGLAAGDQVIVTNSGPLGGGTRRTGGTGGSGRSTGGVGGFSGATGGFGGNG